MSSRSRRLAVLFLACLGLGISTARGQEKPADEKDPYTAQRLAMVKDQIERRGVKDAAVLDVMRKVPRHEFVPGMVRRYAYSDGPLPIGEEQTISQPYIVALMTELLHIKKGAKILEIGTGSGYQAAVLAPLAGEVYSIEILPALAERARGTLAALGYSNVHVKTGDGYLGWPEHAPFDGIVVTAAPDRVPEPLKRQLALGGRMVIPVGAEYQELVVLERTADGFKEERSIPVRFVPMTGMAQRTE